MFAEGGQHEQEITVVGDKGKLEAFVPGNGKIFVGDRTSRAVQAIDVPTDQVLEPGAVVTFGDITLKVLSTGGHTPGASMFFYDDPLGHGWRQGRAGRRTA